jgi:antitoxin PrlF
MPTVRYVLRAIKALMKRGFLNIALSSVRRSPPPALPPRRCDGRPSDFAQRLLRVVKGAPGPDHPARNSGIPCNCSLLKVRYLTEKLYPRGTMATATITSKGQITLPKSVRTKLGVEPGHRVEFIETDAGFLVKSATRDIRALKGILPKPRRPVTIEAMNRSLARMGRVR